jgi:hypothetical protein
MLTLEMIYRDWKNDMNGTAHNLNAYHNGHEWVTYCKLCGLQSEELQGKHCTGKVEPVIKNGVDKFDIDAYVTRMIAAD